MDEIKKALKYVNELGAMDVQLKVKSAKELCKKLDIESSSEVDKPAMAMFFGLPIYECKYVPEDIVILVDSRTGDVLKIFDI